MIVYYNPNCSKCKEAIEVLDGAQCEFEIRNYLLKPPSVEELRALLVLLDCKAMDIVRVKEPLFQEQFAHLNMDEEACLRMLSQYPMLIERPILIDEHRAVIGRPAARIIEFIKK